MLKKGTRVELYSPEAQQRRSFESAHAAAILAMQVGRKTAVWILPEGSKYIYEDGEIRLKKVRKNTKNA